MMFVVLRQWFIPRAVQCKVHVGSSRLWRYVLILLVPSVSKHVWPWHIQLAQIFDDMS